MARSGLTDAEASEFEKLKTPELIQEFVNSIPANFESKGETVHSVRSVLQARTAHCIEGAFVAACALWFNGEPPLLMHLDCAPTDYPHVVVVFKRKTGIGAISKVNGPWLRFRDPVYRSHRELAMSFFHEYADQEGRKTLRSYTAPFDLRRLPVATWLTAPNDCWDVHDRLVGARHFQLLNPAQLRALSRRDQFCRKVSQATEHPPTSARFTH